MPGRETIHRRPRIEELWFGKLRWTQRAMVAGLLPASLAYRVGQSLRNAFWRFAQTSRADEDHQHRQPDRRRQRQNSVHFVSRLAAASAWPVGRNREPRFRPHRERIRAALVSDGTTIKLPPEQAGDEPVMMAKSFRGPIVVARRRIDGVRLLSEIATSRCDRPRRCVSASRVGARRRPGADQSRTRLRQWPSDSGRTDARAAAAPSAAPMRPSSCRAEFPSAQAR